MRRRTMQSIYIVLTLLVSWVVCVIVIWHTRTPCTPSPEQTTCGQIQQQQIQMRTSAFRSTPVYVVEEHHEVLRYWFDAAERGITPKQGNVLLHIDGHSDGATPFRRDILPLFRWPQKKDIANMMQKNDVFIVAAALTGLISRYIWVWPPWDVDEDGAVQNNYTVIEMKLGTITRPDALGHPMLDVCACMKFPKDDFDDRCLMQNITDPMDEDGVKIKEWECNLKLSGIVEIVSEGKAIELMKSGHWIVPQDNVILDIDEDYYGCEAAVQPLYDVGFQENSLRWMTVHVSKLFCPVEPYHERQADAVYRNMIHKALNFKRYCSVTAQSHDSLCTNRREARKAFTQIVPGIFEDIVQKDLRPGLCYSDTRSRKLILALMMLFSRYSIPQLTALAEVGVCHNMSPKTLDFNRMFGMRTCDGYNRPNESAVLFHSPSEDEINLRTSNLNTMLKVEGFHPNLVTVCRSMRDGYTPRKYFRRIENDIIRILQESYSGIHEDSIVYDPYLMGGPFGWPGRS